MKRLKRLTVATITTLLLVLCVFAPVARVPQTANSAEFAATQIMPSPSASETPQFTFAQLGGGVMPILGYAPLHGSNVEGSAATTLITREMYRIYKDAGFNVFPELYTRVPILTDEVMDALDICEELGLVYLACDLTFWLGQNSTVSVDAMKDALRNCNYLSHPALGGFTMVDEPGRLNFAGLSTFMSALRVIAPDKLMHSTLYPAYASAQQLEDKTWIPSQGAATTEQYRKYVNDYITTVHPQLLAYDQYTSYTGVPDDSFYRSIVYYRQKAIDHNTPFMPTVDMRPADLTQNRVDWQVNSHLVFGARAMQYYNYMSSIVTPGGNPTQKYYMVQKTNRQIQAVDSILMNSENKGIMQFGNFVSKEYESIRLNEFGGLYDVSGGEALIGCFTKPDGKPALYIMNNLVDSGKRLLTLNFRKKVGATFTDRNGKTYAEGRTLAVTLSGGEAVMVEPIERS